MQLVEQHVISKQDPRFEAIDQAAFAAKNLYNAALYLVRQAFIFEDKYLSYPVINQLMKDTEQYQALPRKVSQQVLRQLDNNWKAFFNACEEWQAHPEKFLGKPGLPKYLDKKQGRFLLIYTIQALSKPALRRGRIEPSQLAIVIKTLAQKVAQVRIVPRHTHYVVEVVYEHGCAPQMESPYLAGLDIGLDILAAVASDKPGFTPVIVNGRPLKSINQFYNFRIADLQSRLGENCRTAFMEALTDKRNRQINHYLHCASKAVVELLVREGIGTLIIGKNDSWKQEINLGRRNNQNFVQIPHARFIQMLSYKAELSGIRVILTEESWTSKCSFLDNEPLKHHEAYVGKRVHRGLFRASDGRTIHADVNGAYNMIRKVTPEAFSQGVWGAVVHPVRLKIPKCRQKPVKLRIPKRCRKPVRRCL